MKKLFISIQLLFFICSINFGESINSNLDTIKYSEISNIVSQNLFETIKTVILNKGDRETYSSMYGDNPHYSFSWFETYLNPDIGQGNINCDTSKSDFNEIVIRDKNANPQYYYIHIVRKGDLGNRLIHTWEGMSEEKVYLVYQGDENLELLKKYIDTIKSEISTKAVLMNRNYSNSIFVYPNPVKNDIVNIQLPEINSQFSVELIDFKGAILYKQLVNFSNRKDILTLSIKQLPKGLYICKVSNPQRIFINKFLKE